MSSWNQLTDPKAGDAPTLFACLPAGASRNHYKLIWPSDSQSIKVLELPPIRNLSSAPHEILHTMAESIQQAEVDPKNFALFGHSLGGSLALALSSLLTDQFDINSRVILSGVPKPSRLPFDLSSISSFVVEAIADHSSNGKPLPQSFVKMIEQFVKADLNLVPLLSSYASNSATNVAGLFVGTEDPLCNHSDVSWWLTTSPQTKVHRYPGDHFGYMNPKVAKIYRSTIETYFQ